MLRLLLLSLCLALPAAAATKVTLLHMSDYHSHALPFYTEEGERGGIARAVRYLRAEKRRGALVFSGGDTVNKGAPAWSDKYGCAEWPWWNGILDAMAFGNHDADYGLEEFQRCAKSVRYPILSANTSGFRRYAVLRANGARIGVFALAGSDFPQLVTVPGFTFSDPVAAAREAVRELREKERVDAVVMIGHQYVEADYELAKAVPGIDVIFGSHSHLERGLTRIPETSTWFLSPGQYLTLISRVVLTIDDGRVVAVNGGLVPVDGRMREDRAIAKKVKTMQRELERDPEYGELFVPIGRLERPLSVEALAEKTLEAMRDATDADVAISTRSSFRRPLAAGTLTLEALRAALPYDNAIVVCTMSAGELERLVGDDVFVSRRRRAAAVQSVATTDYLAKKAGLVCDETGKRARAELQAALR